MFAKIIAKKENQNLQKSITGKNINLRYRIDIKTFWQIDKDDLALWFAAKNKIFNVPNIKVLNPLEILRVVVREQ